MIDANQILTLTLTAGEVNVLMTGLAEMSFRLSAPVIGKIEQQIREQAPGAYEVPATANGAAEPHGIDGAAR